MFKKLLKKLGLGIVETEIIDSVVTKVANRATHGAASKVEDVVKTVTKKK